MYASSMMVAGVFIHIRIVRVNSPTTMVIIVESNRDIHTLLVIYFLRLLLSFAPKLCATGMANPLQIPIQKPRIMKLMEPVEPTAASELTPSICPTMMESTMLYNCWKSNPNSKGSPNSRMSFIGFPSVKSFEPVELMNLRIVPPPFFKDNSIEGSCNRDYLCYYLLI